MQIGPVEEQVGRPERLLGFTPQRVAADLGPVGPGAEAQVGGAGGLCGDRVEEVQPAQQTRGVGRELDPGTDLGEPRRLLDQRDLVTGPAQARRRRQSPDTRSHDDRSHATPP